VPIAINATAFADATFTIASAAGIFHEFDKCGIRLFLRQINAEAHPGRFREQGIDNGQNDEPAVVPVREHASHPERLARLLGKIHGT
jgi:hypothetical protein